jgi:hypothetical protein
LEILFDRNDVAVKVKGSTDDVDVTECNIGTEKDPKFVKLSSSLSREQRDEYAELLKEFVDVFSWTYEDLRTYDTSVIEHKIPLKEEAKPFRQEIETNKSYVVAYYGERGKKDFGCQDYHSFEVF